MINEVAAVVPSMCKITCSPFLKSETLDETFLLLCEDYRCLINGKEEIRHSTTCCGKLTYQTEHQF